MMQKAARHTLRAVVVTTAAALVLAACSRSERQEVRTEAKQATNATANVVDNAALTTKVKAALIADEMVKGTQINVDSNSGTVKLTGTVDTPAQLARAVEVAKGVSGVQRVENNLASSPNAAPGIVPGTQPPGTAPAATPMPNNPTPPAKKP
ncbi:MAG: BON domain-containing protein [Pseudomonadota bacterium]|nr:BON domain-containing protein [Burkholderiaceae bacterium]MDQ3447196.1 BON domain-containing protein [Pseudomonadota bacterium]